MNNFKEGWYENTAENQEVLFELGYSWSNGPFVLHLAEPYVYTNSSNGYLTHMRVINYNNTPKGTQKQPLTVERIQEARDTISEMGKIDKGFMISAGRFDSNYVHHAHGGKLFSEVWMEKFLPSKSSEQLKLEEVISDLEKSLSDAKAKLEEI